MALTRPRYSQIYDTDYKQSVRAATTGPVGNLLATSNMTNTVDGVTLAVNDRILVKDQADAKQNGIYFVLTVGTGANGTWRRSLDADGGNSKVTSGMTTTVTEGNDNASKTFKLSTPDPILVGTTELTFVNPFVITASAGGGNTQIQFNDTGGVLNGSAGLTFNKNGNVLTSTGNVVSTGGYFLGNAALLSGLPASYGNTQVASYLATYSGNIGNVKTTANVITSAYFVGNLLTNSLTVPSATVDGNLSVGGNASVAGGLTVAGNLTVTGNLTYLNVDNIVIQDPLFYVAEGNQFDFLDIGIVGNYTKNSFSQHGGIVRDASDSTWKFFANVEAEPTTTVDFGSATYDSMLAGNVLSTGNVVVGANITLNGRLFAGGSAGNGSDVLISTGSGVSWTALDKSTLEFDTSSLTLDNIWGNLILNNTSSVSFAGADSTSIFHSNVEVNKNLTVDNKLIVNDTTDFTNPAVNAVQIEGGINVMKTAFFGGNAIVNITTSSTSTSTGALTVTGGTGIGGNLNVGGNLTAGNISTGAVTITNTVIPNANATVNIGGVSSWWNNLYAVAHYGTAGYFSGTLTISGGIYGTISTTSSSQPNITSTGTLTNLQTTSLGVGTAASGTSGEIRATNNITAYFSSDRTLKENIQDIPNALDKVLAIGGKTFDWTDDYIKSHGGSDDYFLRKEDFGVIAQDVQQVFPPAVRQRPDGTLAVDYEKLCALAFQAIVELKAEIDVLKGK